MPQIAQIAATYASQIFWLLIVFGLIYFVIGKGMLPKIEATVDARDQKIASDLAAAEAARAKADETEAAYRARIEEARAAALKATQDAKSAGNAEAEKRVKAADAELATKAAEADAALKAAQAKALAEIENVAAEAAREIVAKVSGIEVDTSAAEGAVKAALAA
ncbi:MULTISPECIES: F0F1 ATP synthase subunit B family protein [unclassified Sphingomonas]|uniref:F0F1 ATP synthase subunit B family protein n=1 Tax=unclassified Sphingomonas TaxID=196159 RepID=UPI0006F622C0|nr:MULTISPECIES: ATPase [unclassified Sphingomonas]KQX18048.1 ATPase [Sphingomonas sp. Root1294]KQY72603.1 ATPase [Sphingomonas sp. Root50]KRB87773.1 ATPase [Sphingomonas sp. Root720]